MLFDPRVFEPLTDEPWDDARVRDAIDAIVADAGATFDSDAFWAPVDEWDTGGGSAPLPLTTLYGGAAGVVWGLDALRRRGFGETHLDLAKIAARAIEAWRADPPPERLESPVRTHASLFGGESGILLAAYFLEPAAEHADALYERVR